MVVCVDLSYKFSGREQCVAVALIRARMLMNERERQLHFLADKSITEVLGIPMASRLPSTDYRRTAYWRSFNMLYVDAQCRCVFHLNRTGFKQRIYTTEQAKLVTLTPRLD